MRTLAERLGISSRRIEQVFRAEVGLTPTAYRRRQRFRATLAAADAATELGWSRIARGQGFGDQPHLFRELRAHSGTPSAYPASRGTTRNHVPVVQALRIRPRRDRGRRADWRTTYGPEESE